MLLRWDVNVIHIYALTKSQCDDTYGCLVLTACCNEPQHHTWTAVLPPVSPGEAVKIILGVSSAGEVSSLLHCRLWTLKSSSLLSGSWAEMFCKACPVHMQGLLWSGDAWCRATCPAVGRCCHPDFYSATFVWEVFGPSLWIPISNYCFLLIAVYVIIPQLIFSRSLWATQCCAFFSGRSSFWCLYSQVKAAALWGFPEEHLQAWHLRAFGGRDLQRRIY